MGKMKVMSKQMAPQSRAMIAPCMTGVLSVMVVSSVSTSREGMLNAIAVKKKATFLETVPLSRKMGAVGLR